MVYNWNIALGWKDSVSRRVVLMENPWFLLPQFGSFFPYSFSEFSKHLSVVMSINNLTFRKLVNVHNPMNVEKNYHHRFEFRFAHLNFFCFSWDWTLPMHGNDLLQNCKWRLRVLGLFPRSSDQLWCQVSVHPFLRASFCSIVRILGTTLAHPSYEKIDMSLKDFG